MTIQIKVRLCCGSYLARAIGLGVTASSAEGAKAAARAACRKLDVDPDLLHQRADIDAVAVFEHPSKVSKQ